MLASTNSLLISVGILFVLVLADPFIDSIADMLRRVGRRAGVGSTEDSDPLLDILRGPQPASITANENERNAA